MKRLKKIRFKYFIFLVLILTLYLSGVMISSTFMRYYSSVTGVAVATGAAVNSYSVDYNLNGGTQAVGQPDYFEDSDLPVTLLDPTKANATFLGWYEESDFSGTRVWELDTEKNYTLYAKWVDRVVVAQVGNNYYETLQAAINAVPTNTRTTVILLKSIAENIEVAQNKIIDFDFQNYELDNVNPSNNGLIRNYGTITISNGTVKTNSTVGGTINNYSTGTITISGGRIISEYGTQALYNDGGTATITGTAYLQNGNDTVSTGNSIKNRAAVQNNNGIMTILGGTICSITDVNPGVLNSKNGRLTIGEEDGDVDVESPVMKGKIGLSYDSNSYTGQINFYDGICIGSTEAYNTSLVLTDIEDGYGLLPDTETIDGQTYHVAYLVEGSIRITYNLNYSNKKEIAFRTEGEEIGEFPNVARSGYVLDWWYTASSGGDEVQEEEILTGDREVFAHWTATANANVAEINGTPYTSLKNAIAAVPTDGTETTITLLRTTQEGNLTVAAGKNIVLDLQSHTIRNKGENRLINNNGKLTIISNGTLRSHAAYAVIDNNTGATLELNDMSIIARGERQTIYNSGGTVRISGNVVLKSRAPDRSTIHNLTNGNVYITGGTIISTTRSAVYNILGNVYIGEEDGTVNLTPVLRGSEYGISKEAAANVYIYDGEIGGETGAIQGGIASVQGIEQGYELDTSNEIYDGTTYEVARLIPIAEP